MGLVCEVETLEDIYSQMVIPLIRFILPKTKTKQYTANNDDA